MFVCREKRALDLASLRLSRQGSLDGSHSSDEDLSPAAELWLRKASANPASFRHGVTPGISNSTSTSANKQAKNDGDALVWL